MLMKKHKKFLFALALILLVSAFSAAQESSRQLESYRSNFDRATLDIKKGLILDVSQKENALDFAPLFQDAVAWVVDNYKLIQTDTRVREIASTSVDILKKAGRTEAAPYIWQLFQLERETGFRIRVLEALAKTVTEEEPGIIEMMDTWLAGRNSIFQTSNSTLDVQVIYSFVETLSAIGASESFPVLFDTYTLQMSGAIQSKAEEGVLGYGEAVPELLLDVVADGESRLQKEALLYGLDSGELSEEQKIAMAEKAVAVALQQVSRRTDDLKNRREMRYEAANFLGAKAHSEATDLLVDHFDATLEEYRTGFARRDFFLEAIAALGAMNSEAAAQKLTQYLHYLNQQKENNKPYDPQVVRAVLTNIKDIGNPLSFDELTYMRHLKYSESVLALVEEAINSIKWE